MEHEEHLVILRSLGVEAAQGYYLGRPMPAEYAARLVVPEAHPQRGIARLPVDHTMVALAATHSRRGRG